MSALTLFNEPFDMDKIKFINDDIYYDGEDCGDNLEFLNHLLIINGWACGCGMPDKATVFFIRQLRAFASGEDFHTFQGGLDLFKIACYHRGFIDINGALTLKGNEFLSIATHVGITNDDLASIQVNKLPVPKLLIKGNVDETIAQVFEQIEVSPDLANAFLALQYIGFFGSFLRIRSKQWDEARNPRVLPPISEEYHKWCEVRFGEIYNTWHILENILDMEEHGGSTPGWLTEEGNTKLDAIEQLFDCDDFFHLYLKD